MDTLAAFEAAARHQSFTVAARELHLTQAAVSRQIRILEENLGTRLFTRSHRAVQLTASGRAFQHTVAMALSHLVSACKEIRERPTSASVTVATDQSIAWMWLMPRLSRFRDKFPNIPVRMIVSDFEADTLSQDIDIAIIHGDGHWSGYRSNRLFEEEVFPVCSPAFLETHGPVCKVNELAGLTLLELEDDHWDWMNWRIWLTENGVKTPIGKHSMRINNYPLAIQAACDGLGMALGWRYLVDKHIEDGTLVKPIDAHVKTKYGYYVVYSADNTPSPHARCLIDWILQAVKP
jgi:putative choline sulfate-utilization transcription factor